MKRSQLEHIIRAAAAISDDTDIVIIGSQAILGQCPDPPSILTVSIEADVYPRNHPERWDLIDGSIGEGSHFHSTFGYYAQGVDQTTATLPAGWEQRLIPIHNANTRGATGWALELHDLLISKYVAGRDKDLAFTQATAQHHLAEESVLHERLAVTLLPTALRPLVEARIRADFATQG
jgi:hypothetical protein